MKPTRQAQAEVGLKRQKIAAKRRFLRARRLRVSDLDPDARDLLETFGSATAKLEALAARRLRPYFAKPSQARRRRLSVRPRSACRRRERFPD